MDSLSFTHPGVITVLVLLAIVVIGVVAWIVFRGPKGGGTTLQAPPKEKKETAELPKAQEIPQAEPESSRAPPEEVEEESVEVEEVIAPQPEVETPESVTSRMQRLRARLARSGVVGNALLSVLSRGQLSESDWEEIEDTLLMADLGLDATDELLGKLRTEVKVRGSVKSDEAKEILRTQLLELVGPDADRTLNITAADDKPATVLVVGVNGTGKTTTVGKMARLLRAEDKSVLLGAADTFRAAAAEQLTTWGDRVGVDVVRSEKEGGDPAAVAFDAVKTGIDNQVDVVIVDTAGRLQTKSALMDELGKVKRVMEKQTPVDEVLLVLDATTGQNGMRQAEVFAEVVGITGVVLTKLDGSAKGGIVVSVQRELGVPVKLVGLGEGPDDLAPFDPQGFVDAIVGE